MPNYTEPSIVVLRQKTVIKLRNKNKHLEYAVT